MKRSALETQPIEDYISNWKESNCKITHYIKQHHRKRLNLAEMCSNPNNFRKISSESILKSSSLNNKINKSC